MAVPGPLCNNIVRKNCDLSPAFFNKYFKEKIYTHSVFFIKNFISKLKIMFLVIEISYSDLETIFLYIQNLLEIYVTSFKIKLKNRFSVHFGPLSFGMGSSIWSKIYLKIS